MKQIKETCLQYKSSGSNKVYNVYLLEVSKDAYLVNFEYGRFGGKLKEGTKTTSAVGLEKAEKTYKTLVLSKTKKEYKIISGFDPEKKETKKEKVSIDFDTYKKILLDRLQRVKEVDKKGRLKKVDNYEVSRLIYRAGELKLEEAKASILNIYALETKEDNVFYYSLAWALGRFKDNKFKTIIANLRDKLEDGSKYIVQEALFLSGQKLALSSIVFPIDIENREKFNQEVFSLTQEIESVYKRYKETDSWYEKKKEGYKNSLIPLLQRADELYLKLYIGAFVDAYAYALFIENIRYIPINQLNFSLFRRIYKMAEIRDDYTTLGHLNTLLESKKISCSAFYDNEGDGWKKKNSIGCSKLYFKRRALRYIKDLGKYNEEAYLAFAKSILLSTNDFKESFKAFSVYYYDENWNYKKKNYDVFCEHILFIYILYGAGQRYMLSTSKKIWEVTNQTIKNESRVEAHKEIWDKNPLVAVEILAKSSIKEVQLFAFNIIKEHQDVIANLSLDILLEMMNLKYEEALLFFFEIVKKRYEKENDNRMLQAFILSSHKEVATYGLDALAQNLTLLTHKNFVNLAIDKLSKEHFERLLTLLNGVSKAHALVEDIINGILSKNLPLDKLYVLRVVEVLKVLSGFIKEEDIERLMEQKVLNDYHLIAGKLIREVKFQNFKISLELKEKIASFEHPEMLATTLYLLGELSDDELMDASLMLVAFLYNNEKVVAKEAEVIIGNLGKANEEYAKILLAQIVEQSFKSASDETIESVMETIKNLSLAYQTFDNDTLYRLLVAKSKLAQSIGNTILNTKEAKEFSVVQWARFAKNPNLNTRKWVFSAYRNHKELVKDAMPKSLMIFDTIWEDTRAFACEYFKDFEPLSSDDVIVIADSNYKDIQQFAKEMIMQKSFDKEIILSKLSQHPSSVIQKFVTDLMLKGLTNRELLNLERFFNTLLHSVNRNRVAKTRVLEVLKSRLENEEIAKMIGRLSAHHSASMVWADKTIFVEIMSALAKKYDFALPLENIEVKEVNDGV